MKNETIKKDFMSYLKSNNKLKELNEKINEEEQEFWRNQNKVTEYLKGHTYEQAKKHFEKEREENTKRNETKQDLYKERKKEILKNDLLYNNLLYSISKKYDLFLIETMEKYKNKAIGEKTQQKIEEEIKEEIKKEDIFKKAEIYIYFRGDYNNYEITIQAREKQEEKYLYMIEYKLQKKTSYNAYTEETKIFYYRYKASNFNYSFYSIDNLLYLENINKEISYILKEEEKNKKAIEKEIETLKENIKKYNNVISSYNLNGEQEKQYKIDKTLYLY